MKIREAMWILFIQRKKKTTKTPLAEPTFKEKALALVGWFHW